MILRYLPGFILYTAHGQDGTFAHIAKARALEAVSQLLIYPIYPILSVQNGTARRHGHG